MSGEWREEERDSWLVARGSTIDDGPVKSYRDLRVWRLSVDWVEEIYRESARWPKDERFGLVAQVRRAAVSVASNIAEGAERRTTGEFQQFLGIAQGSLAEVETQLFIPGRLAFTCSQDLERLLAHGGQIGRMISGLKTSLKRPR